MVDEAKRRSADLWPAGRPSPYANHLEINIDMSEIELCFAQDFGPGAEVVPYCWILTSPVHLVSFGQAISRTIARYESLFGRIPGQTDPDLPIVR